MIPLNTTIIANASINASEMVCGCLEKSWAKHAAKALKKARRW